MSVSEETIGDLNTIHVAGPSEAPAIVLLHGFGAHFHDLLPLHRYIFTPVPCAWYFPNGTEDAFPGLPGMAKAWFPLSVERFTQLAAAEDFTQIAAFKHPGLDEATNKLNCLIEHLAKKHSKIIIGGFSQGAMVATNLALTSTAPLAALVVFSGSVTNEPEWAAKAKQRKNLAVFQSHGRFDPVLPFALGERLRNILEELDTVAFRAFDGMHEIPQPILKACGSFLEPVFMHS